MVLQHAIGFFIPRPVMPEVVSTILDIDGNEYNTVIIGNQEWIVENLKTTHYADGTLIPNILPDTNSDELVTLIENNVGINAFDSFNSIGNSFSAANDEFSRGTAMARYLIPADDSNYMKIVIDITLNSGQLPICYFGSEEEGSELLTLEVGQNIFLIDTSLYTKPLDLFVDFRNGDFATEEWFATDFDATVSVIALGWINDTEGAMCYYNNNIANKPDYGALYNWYAVDNAHELTYFERNGVQEVDWRVPSDADFTILSDFLGGNAIAGGKLKEVGLAHWNSPNTGATDEYGFKAIGTGARSYGGIFTNLNGSASFWSINQYDAISGSLLDLEYDQIEAFIMYDNKPSGRAVRCVRNI